MPHKLQTPEICTAYTILTFARNYSRCSVVWKLFS